jgi:hypothetical protein
VQLNVVKQSLKFPTCSLRSAPHTVCVSSTLRVRILAGYKVATRHSLRSFVVSSCIVWKIRAACRLHRLFEFEFCINLKFCSNSKNTFPLNLKILKNKMNHGCVRDVNLNQQKLAGKLPIYLLNATNRFVISRCMTSARNRELLKVKSKCSSG